MQGSVVKCKMDTKHRRDSWPELEFHAPTLAFDTIWKNSLGYVLRCVEAFCKMLHAVSCDLLRWQTHRLFGVSTA